MSWMRFLHRKRSDAELQNEIEAFLSEETADNVARGMSPDEARRQARIKLGNVQKVRESLWAQNSPQLLTGIGRDLKLEQVLIDEGVVDEDVEDLGTFLGPARGRH